MQFTLTSDPSPASSGDAVRPPGQAARAPQSDPPRAAPVPRGTAAGPPPCVRTRTRREPPSPPFLRPRRSTSASRPQRAAGTPFGLQWGAGSSYLPGWRLSPDRASLPWLSASHAWCFSPALSSSSARLRHQLRTLRPLCPPRGRRRAQSLRRPCPELHLDVNEALIFMLYFQGGLRRLSF